MTRSVLALALLAISSAAYAGGLVLPEPNAAALGRAGAATAIPDGPSALYYNPAGITIGAGLALEASVAVDLDRTAITVAGDTARASSTSAVPSVFLTQRLGDHFGVGLGVRRAIAQALDYPDDFVGRFRVQQASFDGITLSPTVAGRPWRFLSIGFGLDVTFGNITLAQAEGDPRFETRLSYAGKAIGIGGSIGLLAHLYRDYLTFGWTYHSAMDLDQTGQTKRSLPTSDVPLMTEDARLTLPLPHVFVFALGSQPRLGTTVQAEARVGLLKDLDGFTLKDTASPPSTILALPLSNRPLVQLRAGVEQHVVHDRLALRLGVGYDFGSARRDLDPAFPDGDRVVVAAGIGYHRPELCIDAGYLGSFSPGSAGSRGYAYPADYAQQRHSLALTMTIRVANIGPKPQRFD
jgi:long-chain fatty acid transport protein